MRKDEKIEKRMTVRLKICSACLLGMKCRYDDKSKPNKKVLELAKKEVIISVCPEQMGGLPTPRISAEIIRGKVITKDGRNVTANFKKGARETLKVAKLYNAKGAILKQRSPSCGSGKIYDGTFSGKIIEGWGITAKLLKKKGIKIISEEEL